MIEVQIERGPTHARLARRLAKRNATSVVEQQSEKQDEGIDFLDLFKDIFATVIRVARENQDNHCWVLTQRKELVQLVRKLIEAHARKLHNVCKLTDTGIDDFKNIYAPIYEVVKEKQHDHRWLKNMRNELARLERKVTDARALNDARKLTDAQRDTEMQKYNAAEFIAERIVERIAECIDEHVLEKLDNLREPTTDDTTTDTDKDATNTDENTTDTD